MCTWPDNFPGLIRGSMRATPAMPMHDNLQKLKVVSRRDVRTAIERIKICRTILIFKPVLHNVIKLESN